MKAKNKRIAAAVLTGIPALVLAIGGVLKITGLEAQAVVKFLDSRGFGELMVPLGALSVAIAVLMVVPRTAKTGFLLACCYFGGALAMEISGEQFPASALFLSLAWTGMFIAHREMFVRQPV